MRLPGWFWGVFATVLLGAGLLAGAVMLFVSWNHPSLTADADYYRRGVEYDAFKAQQARNEALGWTPALRAERIAEGGVPGVRVTLDLADRSGSPLEGAEVTLETFHLARAGERFRSALPMVSPGEYAAVLPLRRTGIWEFRLTVHRGEDLYTAVLEREF